MTYLSAGQLEIAIDAPLAWDDETNSTHEFREDWVHGDRTPEASGPLVLLADADGLLIRAIADRLHDYGYSAILAASAHQALELAQERGPNAAVIDLSLPGLYGGSVARTLRLANPHMPIVIVSSLTVAVTSEDAWRVQAYAYLSKPFEVGALVEILRQALTQRR
ncbi:MAG: response regulator [Chloroflexi bacterium]|nr:response regulator [Chloroflexota bacterium]